MNQKKNKLNPKLAGRRNKDYQAEINETENFKNVEKLIKLKFLFFKNKIDNSQIYSGKKEDLNN